MRPDIHAINKIAVEAGKAIMSIYNSSDPQEDVTMKSDNSPLTIADQLSHNYIVQELKKLTPGIPVISEEGSNVAYQERKNWPIFWLVDPLDGTKEFIKRNGEFTVNIALIENNFPIMGVIYVPATGTLYYAEKNTGAFKKQDDTDTEKIYSRKLDQRLIAVGSRSHATVEEINLLQQYNAESVVAIGSSLKFCLIAEGKADIYYRHNPTMEWDTSAGQAIVEASGGIVCDENNDQFSYNKESLKNKSFLCLGDRNNLKVMAKLR